MLLLNSDVFFNCIICILRISNMSKGNILSSFPQIPKTPNIVLNTKCIASKYSDG